MNVVCCDPSRPRGSQWTGACCSNDKGVWKSVVHRHDFPVLPCKQQCGELHALQLHVYSVKCDYRGDISIWEGKMANNRHCVGHTQASLTQGAIWAAPRGKANTGIIRVAVPLQIAGVRTRRRHHC